MSLFITLKATAMQTRGGGKKTLLTMNNAGSFGVQLVEDEGARLQVWIAKS